MCSKEKKFEEIANRVVRNKNGNLNINEKRLCPDCFVAKIEIDINNNNGHIRYIKDAVKNADSRSTMDSELRSEDYPIIAIVLESPHKDEYKGTVSPLLATNSSVRLRNYLLPMLYNFITTISCQGSIYSRGTREIENGIYRIKLINAVQFQCSLGGNLSDKHVQEIKNEIVCCCLKNRIFANDFSNRLKDVSIIINCCTGQKDGKIDGLQKNVQDIIDKKYPNKIRLFGYHPSSLHFLKGFKKV